MEKRELRARQKLAGACQDHLFKYWDDLTTLQKESLLQQIDRLDLPSLRWQQQVLSQKNQAVGVSVEAFDSHAKAGVKADIEKGKRLISEGKVACIIVAGGQGSRLRITGPKGKCPVSNIKGKSLFQLFAEKTLAAGKEAGKMLRLAVMTSPQNHAETTQFFADHANFGLSSLQLSFFSQGTLPLLDLEGDLFLEEQSLISLGADGNGSCLKSFVESGIWETWKKAKIEYVSFVLVDNPLADPYDANLVGCHSIGGQDVTIKCVERTDPKEKVGVVVKKDGYLRVLEYSEIPEKEQTAKLPNGALKHHCANTGLFCFSMDFIQEAASATAEMPLHLALKSAKALDNDGLPLVPLSPNAWKYERFIFDVLPMASKVGALVYLREHCFAPLKNFDGEDSLETVKSLLYLNDKRIIEDLTHQAAPNHLFELSQDFYYPTQALQEKWDGRTPPLLDYYDDKTIPL